MEYKRIFIGTYIDNTLIKDIYENIQSDFEPACSGKWVEPENLHLTYKFLGDVEVGQIDVIKRVLKENLKHFDSGLIIKGLGAFPDTRNPRVLYITVHNPGEILLRIQSGIEKELNNIGYKSEERKFKPHVTLLRIKNFDSKLFRQCLDKYNDYDFGKMPGFSVNIIESKLTPHGPIYKILN